LSDEGTRLVTQSGVAGASIRDRPTEVTAMTEEALRTKTRWGLWLAVAICLMPLVPYALNGIVR